MEYASATGCSGEVSSKGNSTYWTADEGHSWDGGKWSLDSLISSTSLNYDELEDKVKGTYKLPGNLEEEETYGIVKTGPEQYLRYTLTRPLRKMDYRKLPHISRKTPQKTTQWPPPF